jgi:hypothetical protein
MGVALIPRDSFVLDTRLSVDSKHDTSFTTSEADFYAVDDEFDQMCPRCPDVKVCIRFLVKHVIVASRPATRLSPIFFAMTATTTALAVT